MARYELLNAQDHGILRLCGRSPSEPSLAVIVPSEFASAAAHCPVLFSKDPETGHFYAGALMGFKSGESFLHQIRERTGFEPLSLQRDGFFTIDDDITIDRDNPRFSDTVGEPLFEDDLSPSPYLRQMQRLIGEFKAGLTAASSFIQQMLDLRLIEAIDIRATFEDGETITLEGLYTVSMDKLQELEEQTITELFRKNYLHLIYSMHISLNQIPVLCRLRNSSIKLEEK